MKVLIADDDAVSRMMLARSLRQMGYEVLPVNNGREALRELCRADGPRLALLDWMMPEMDGPQVCTQVRAAGLEKYTYLALLTSRGSPED
ncbi:MAG TPA: response regulator, partial [Bryobacteraceae bacterium]|nr:response regulator [Bryobacteraceae bacterium]